ncbi:MAG TPA: DUF4160 domain-containing protein [Candidatus Bathyarchaeia archaeon]|nr:DUF4160 domain-containing protein [Candidatus Bathyarchaeia archaeon]
MPTVLRSGPYRFFFFSNEGTEPPHVHVESGKGYAKFALEPVEVVFSMGYKRSELTTLRDLVIENARYFKEEWDAHFHG